MRKWLREAFEDVDGRGSFSRLASVPLVFAVTFALVYIVVKSGRLPTESEAVALATVGGFLYFGNQVKGVTAAFKGAFSGPPPPPAPPPG